MRPFGSNCNETYFWREAEWIVMFGCTFTDTYLILISYLHYESTENNDTLDFLINNSILVFNLQRCQLTEKI